MDRRPNLQGLLPAMAEQYIRELSINLSQLQSQVSGISSSTQKLTDAVTRVPTSVLLPATGTGSGGSSGGGGVGGGGGGTSTIAPPTGLSITVNDFIQAWGTDWLWTPSVDAACVGYAREYKFEAWDGASWVIDSDWGSDLMAYPETSNSATDGPFPKISGQYRLYGRIAAIDTLGGISTWVTDGPYDIIPYGSPNQPPAVVPGIEFRNTTGISEYRFKGGLLLPIVDAQTAGISWQFRLLSTATYTSSADVLIDWFEYAFQYDPQEVFPKYWTDWWPTDVVNRYGQVRGVPVNADGTAGTAREGPIIIIFGGFSFDPRVIDPSLLGPGLDIDQVSGIIKTTSEGFLDGDFQFGLKEWSYTPGVTASTDGFSNSDSALLTANGTEVALWQRRPITAGQFVRLQAASKRTSITGTVPAARPLARISFFDAAGSLLGGGEGVAYFTQYFNIGSNPWTVDVLVWGEAPAGAAEVRVYPYWLPSAATGGTANVDMVAVGIYEPGSSEITRDPTTGRISFNVGALGSMTKYPSYCRPVLNGPTDPTADTTAIASATNGSYYINTSSRKIFKRVGAVWTNVEAADVVAGGTFIGNALNLVGGAGVTVNVAVASDGSSGAISGYFGVSVEYTAAAQYKSVMSPDYIWIYHKDFATTPYNNSGVTTNGVICSYGKSGANISCSQLYAFGSQTANTINYAYGQLILTNYAGGNGNSAGVIIDGNRVVRERQTLTLGTYTAPSTAYPTTGTIIDFTGFSIFFEGTAGWCKRINDEVEQLKTNVAAIKTFLQTHGLAS